MKKMYYFALTGAVAFAIACNQGAPAETPKLATEKTAEESVTRGKYLVEIMGCGDCHSPKMMTPQGPAPDTNLLLSGHPASMPIGPIDANSLKSWVLFNHSQTATVGPWGVSFSANLTSDPSGIGNWTEAQFIKALREGKAKGLDDGRTLLPPMPWPNYANATDEDLKDIFAFLKSTKPVQNVVPAPIPPAQ
jgi:hypothetical protein